MRCSLPYQILATWRDVVLSGLSTFGGCCPTWDNVQQTDMVIRVYTFERNLYVPPLWQKKSNSGTAVGLLVLVSYRYCCRNSTLVELSILAKVSGM
jgi:hypothetical protein